MYESHQSKGLGISQTRERLFRRASVNSYQLPSIKEPAGRGVRRKMSQAVFKVGTLSQRNKARAQYYTQSLSNRGPAEIWQDWVTVPTSTQLSEMAPRSGCWRNEPKRQGSTWLPSKGSQIFSNFLWSPPNLCFLGPWKWCRVLITIEMSYDLFFQNAYIYIYHLYVIAFKGDKSLIGRAGDINHTHWWHWSSGVLGTGCVGSQPGDSQCLSQQLLLQYS